MSSGTWDFPKTSGTDYRIQSGGSPDGAGVGITKGDTDRNKYMALINHEFRSLQLDKSLSSMSVFDLIDLCASLFEESTANRSTEKGLRLYVRSYLIFNYFVNTFIMVHFNGFDKFMESSHQDFIIYLNLHNFYRSDDILGQHAFGADLPSIRAWVLEYLDSKHLLNFDVNLLYTWLDEYIEYLKNKEDSPVENVQNQDLPDSSHKNGTSVMSPLHASGPDDDLFDFNSRFPDLSSLPPSPKMLKSDQQFGSKGSGASVAHYDAPARVVHQVHRTTATPYPLVSPSDIHIPGHRSQNDLKYSRPAVPPPPVPVPPVPVAANYIASDPALEYKHQTHNNPTMPPTTSAKFRSETFGAPVMAPINLRKPATNHDLYSSRYDARQNKIDTSSYIQYSGSNYETNNNMRPTHYVNHNLDSIGRFNGSNGRSEQPPIPPAHGYSQMSPLSHATMQQGQNRGSNGHGTMHSHSKSGARKVYAVCGLKNLGSSCYINSIVQTLVGLETFDRLILGRKKSRRPSPLTDAMEGLISTFNANGGANIAPTKFLRVLSSIRPDFNIPFEQQDAQEFLLILLDKLHEEMAVKPNDDTIDYLSKWDITVNSRDKEEYLKWYKELVNHEGESPMNDTFQGHVQSKLVCNKCGHKSISYSPFTILSLPIPAGNSQSIDLTDCLRYYTQDEVLTGENAWKCPNCNKSASEKEKEPNPMDVVFQPKRGLLRFSKRSKSPSKKTSSSSGPSVATSISIKQLSFIKLPQVMFIHLSRFSMMNVTDKLNTDIVYPLRLKFNHSNHDIYYNLTGIINHYGTLKSGHYTALVNKAKSGGVGGDMLSDPLWCFFDDDNVRFNVQHGSVHSPELNKLHSRDVYVLCYERL